MTGHSRFSDLTDGFSERRKNRIKKKSDELLEKMSMAELRQALHHTQQQLASDLAVSQPAIARMEQRTDMHVSSLRRVIEAMGGELEVRARFPQGTVTLTNFASDSPADGDTADQS
jgi:DNA-binding XRE family transcriptional regulator